MKRYTTIRRAQKHPRRLVKVQRYETASRGRQGHPRSSRRVPHGVMPDGSITFDMTAAAPVTVDESTGTGNFVDYRSGKLR